MNVMAARDYAISDRLAMVSTVASGVIVLMGLAVLVGWSTGSLFLESLLPGAVAMNPVTAVSFMFCGVCVLSIVANQPRRWTFVLSAVVVSIAALRLLVAIGGQDSGVDYVLFRSRMGLAAVPNHMAPNTAACFVLFGISLLSIHVPEGPFGRPSVFTALPGLIIACCAVLGYLNDAHEFVQVATFIPMAFNTALCFMLMGIAILCARPDHRLITLLTSQTMGARIARRLILPVTVIFPAMGYLVDVGEQYRLYDTGFGTSLLVFCAISVFLTLILWNAVLFHRVEEDNNRVTRLAHEAACRAQAEAEQANRAKSEFLSRMSHELRTPMNAVLGFAQLLQFTLEDPDAQSNVAQILKAGKHLLALIDEVLDISRIESGRLLLSVESVRIGDVIEEVMLLMAPIAVQNGIELSTQDSEFWNRYALVDRQRIKQVLLNLVSNAIKYNSQNGSVFVECATTVDGRLRIIVRDTGKGIPESMLDRLFTPFDRLNADQTSIEGTGLGLALSKRLIEIMGGMIAVESAEGGGSKFYIDVAFGENPSSVAANEIAATAFPTEVSTRDRTVLYIEDNKPNLELVEAIFKRRPDLKLLSAMQGRLGIDLAREHQPDLILLDMNLPDLHGQEVLKLLQDDARCRNIPVVIISADAISGRVERMLRAGAKAYLTKPISVADFMSVLDDVLKAA